MANCPIIGEISRLTDDFAERDPQRTRFKRIPIIADCGSAEGTGGRYPAAASLLKPRMGDREKPILLLHSIMRSTIGSKKFALGESGAPRLNRLAKLENVLAVKGSSLGEASNILWGN